MQVCERNSYNLAHAAFGRHRSEEDPRWGWEYSSWLLSLGLFWTARGPKKRTSSSFISYVAKIGGSLWCFFWLLFPLNLTRVKIFFCINQNIWHRLCGIVAAFWRFGIWTKKLLELISSYFHNGNNKDLIKSQNKCHSIHHNIYWTKVYFQKIQASGIFYQSLGESVLPENINLAPR